MSFKSTGYAKAKTVSRGDLRDDRPPHGRGGRASKDDGMDTSCEVGVIYAILNLHVQ
ncbi:hypothetical protein [Shewanella oncorhynchi]|uniref:hypothetical protein n=1 Tax=Shewanella oncorhynchi TaxID=2726434 RepID=UPI003D7C0376